MKWAYLIKYKIKAAFILLVILATILLSNLHERYNFKVLDQRISSIYEDRLMPATYIYELSNHFYQKRLLQENPANYTTAQLQAQVNIHDEAITRILTDYEKTYLTTEENNHWKDLKSSLYNYNRQYEIALTALRDDKQNQNNEQLAVYFNQMTTQLDALSKIQAGVGRNLEKDSHAIINSTVIPSYLENSLLIVLGIICVVLFTVSDNHIIRSARHSSLN